MRSLLQVLITFLVLPSLLLMMGCKEANDPAPVESSSNGSGEAVAEGEEVVRDTLFHVVERRRSGGQLQPTGESSEFNGEPRMGYTPVVCMIIVEGNETGERSAYLLPEEDYRQVREGHRLQESTLARWESTDVDHIPAPPPPPESPLLRSRTGGAAENLVY